LWCEWLANSLTVRRSAKEGAALPKDITADLLADDKLLIPVLEDDALIFCLDDLPEPAVQGQQQSSSTEAKGKEAQAANGESGPAVDDLLQKNAQLQTELEQLAKQFTNYRLAVESTLDKRWGVDDESQKGESSGKTTAAEPAPKQRDESAYYFESYAHNGRPPSLSTPIKSNTTN
jgi:type I protein arginine methyltransferase